MKPCRALIPALLATATVCGAVLSGAALSGAAAQNAYCMVPGTRQIDQRGTATFQQLSQQADPQVMQMLTGVWYAELRSPATNQVSYQYNSYEPGGLFSYQNRVCGGMANACSDYQGTGLYAARRTGDGSFFGMLIVSDLNRDHQCTSLGGRFADPTTLISSDGTAWRRVR